jgi:glycine oxidase
MIDSIVVGYGLAGFNIAWQLKQHQKSFLILSDPSYRSASENAAGIFNPTVLKRYTMAWEGLTFTHFALAYYKQIESEFNTKLFYSLPIHRHFYNEGEQNHWTVASQQAGLSHFLNPTIKMNTEPTLKNHSGYGIVEKLGKLEIQKMLSAFKQRIPSNRFKEEEFDYTLLKILKDKISYAGVEARNIIFCEGFGLKKNPWFNYLPLTGSKGEYLIVKAPLLKRKQILKGSVFVTPIEENLFWVGASFSHKDKSATPTEKGRNWLQEQLDKMLNTPYEIIDHAAAVRPTVVDRKPLLGVHPFYSNLFLFNGLGTRGVLMAPLLSKWLFEFITQKKQLPAEVAINRFEGYFSSLKK